MQDWLKKKQVRSCSRAASSHLPQQQRRGRRRAGRGQGGKHTAIRARKAVISAPGASPRARRRRSATARPIFAAARPTNTGDFVDIGIARRAPRQHEQRVWVQNLVEQALEFSSVRPRSGSVRRAMVIVNKYGNRITCEKMVYNERTQSHFWWDASRRSTNLVQFMVYDASVYNDKTAFAFRQRPYRCPGRTRRT